MRKDVVKLLAKLGRREFRYQEFADRFSDVELWPLFETLIHDPRILTAPPDADHAEAAVTANATANAAPQSAPRITTQAPEPSPVPTPPQSGAKDLSNLFARYGGHGSEDTPADVHALLQKLAQQIEQGKL